MEECGGAESVHPAKARCFEVIIRNESDFKGTNTVDTIPVEVLLGMDFLQTVAEKIDLQKKRVMFTPEREFPL